MPTLRGVTHAVAPGEASGVMQAIRRRPHESKRENARPSSVQSVMRIDLSLAVHSVCGCESAHSKIKNKRALTEKNRQSGEPHMYPKCALAPWAVLNR